VECLTEWLREQTRVPLEWEQVEDGFRADAKLGGEYTVLPYDEPGRPWSHQVRFTAYRHERGVGRLIKRTWNIQQSKEAAQAHQDKALAERQRERALVGRQNGKAIRINAPHPETQEPSLPQTIIARWPRDGLGINLGFLGQAVADY
jgi:hypothetical protein